jgi:proprotein convertase subtilisin/kexin type 5
MLNNYSCLTTCTTGYGYTEDPALCIWCNLRCASCYSVFDNCTSCKTSNPWKSYLFYNDTLGYWICVASCPDTYFANTTSNTCELCDPVCATCNKNSTYCLSCINTYGWLDDYFCYSPCPVGYYVSNGTNNCTRCNLTCISCTD